MRIRIIGTAVTLLALAAVGCAQQGEAALVGKQAPSFEAKTTEGKTLDLKGLTADGPVFLVFWKEQCPHNPRAASIINELSSAYKGKARVVGVVTARPDGAARWRQEFGIEYPLLSDGEKSIIGAFGLRKSIVTILVDKGGKVTKTFPGYGVEEMTALNEAMAGAAGVEPAKVDLSKAQPRLTYG